MNAINTRRLHSEAELLANLARIVSEAPNAAQEGKPYLRPLRTLWR